MSNAFSKKLLVVKNNIESFHLVYIIGSSPDQNFYELFPIFCHLSVRSTI